MLGKRPPRPKTDIVPFSWFFHLALWNEFDLKLEMNDPSSLSNIDDIKTTHMHIKLQVLFEKKQLHGSVLIKFTRKHPNVDKLILDTHDIIIHQVTKCGTLNQLPWHLGESKGNPALGTMLTITLSGEEFDNTEHSILINYSTKPTASALQWLEPS